MRLAFITTIVTLVCTQFVLAAPAPEPVAAAPVSPVAAIGRASWLLLTGVDRVWVKFRVMSSLLLEKTFAQIWLVHIDQNIRNRHRTYVRRPKRDARPICATQAVTQVLLRAFECPDISLRFPEPIIFKTFSWRYFIFKMRDLIPGESNWAERVDFFLIRPPFQALFGESQDDVLSSERHAITNDVWYHDTVTSLFLNNTAFSDLHQKSLLRYGMFQRPASARSIWKEWCQESGAAALTLRIGCVL
ncbi:hypothetical protein BU17DRAFT_71591 [Hysterangium stoloniferum]|nr:hypothetical protein BU17DRAFT_71591 [Hysterangium stoloniferum]